MKYLARIAILFYAFILANIVVAQQANVLPELKPSYTQDLLKEKQGINVDCVSDIFLDSHGQLWLQTCRQTSNKELRFVKYDGYRFDEVAIHNPQYQQDCDLFALGISNSDQLYGRYEVL